MDTKFSHKIWKVIRFIVLIASPLIPFLIPDINKRPLLLFLSTSGYLILVAKLSVDFFDTANFLWNRLLLWLFNKEVSWSMSVDFHGDFTAETIDEISKQISLLFPEIKLWRNDQKGKVIELPFGGAMRLELRTIPNGPDDEDSILFLGLSNFVVSFRHSEETLSNLFKLIDQGIRDVAKPVGERYTFKMKFGETNPYFGLFVRRLRLPERTKMHFSVDFKEQKGATMGSISVSGERVTITTENLQSLQSLSHKYITLASFDPSGS